VLQAVPKRQQEDFSLLIEEAADAVMSLVTEGLEKAQERFNRNVIGTR